MQQNPYIQNNPYMNQPAGLPGSPAPQSGALSKPGFGNLTTGRPPIDEVIGIIQDWKVEFDPQYQSSNFHLLMQNIQVLHSQSPWPYTECDIRIRVGTGLNGGWGLFGQSIAAQLGCSLDAVDVDLLKGQWVHLVCIHNWFYGVNNQNGQVMTGDVWKLHRFLQPGENPAPMFDTYARDALASGQSVVPQPAAGGQQAGYANGQVAPNMATAQGPSLNPQAVQPIAQQAAPQAAQTLPHQMAPSQPMPNPMPSQAVGQQGQQVAQVPQATEVVPQQEVIGQAIQTPLERATSLLLGSTKSQFFEKAVVDETIRKDPSLMAAITGDTFIAGLLSSGAFFENSLGVFETP